MKFCDVCQPYAARSNGETHSRTTQSWIWTSDCDCFSRRHSTNQEPPRYLQTPETCFRPSMKHFWISPWLFTIDMWRWKRCAGKISKRTIGRENGYVYSSPLTMTEIDWLCMMLLNTESLSTVDRLMVCIACSFKLLWRLLCLSLFSSINRTVRHFWPHT